MKPRTARSPQRDGRKVPGRSRNITSTATSPTENRTVDTWPPASPRPVASRASMAARPKATAEANISARPRALPVSADASMPPV
jgi:hypothetical protein